MSRGNEIRSVAQRKGSARFAPRSPAGFALAVHGGAGVIEHRDMTSPVEQAYRDGIADALETGRRVLAAGGSSIDAVVAAVSSLEDNPRFNAGRGAVFTAEGTNELDASVMDGATLRAGAVALVTTVRNPVRLARLVMEKTSHVLVAGAGAEALAREHGLEIVEPGYFHTERRWNALQRMKQSISAKRADTTAADTHGTVGAVALDAAGNLAAATSTGGRTNKLAGRIGDSAIVGAGTYADNATAAVSCTGEGELFMRAVAAHAVSDLMALKGWSVTRAAGYMINRKLASIQGHGGLIAMDRRGNVAMPFSSEGMYRGVVRSDRAPQIAIFRR